MPISPPYLSAGRPKIVASLLRREASTLDREGQRSPAHVRPWPGVAGKGTYFNHRSVLWLQQTLPVSLLLKLPVGGEKVNKRNNMYLKKKKKKAARCPEYG